MPCLAPLAKLVEVLAAVMKEDAGWVAIAGGTRVQRMVRMHNLHLDTLPIYSQHYCCKLKVRGLWGGVGAWGPNFLALFSTMFSLIF